MKNITEINNTKRQKMLLGVCLSIGFFLLFAFVILICSLVVTKNCNGEVSVVEVTIKEITYENDTDTLLSEKGNRYSLGPVIDEVEWSSYLGKTVLIITPAEQFSGDPWVLGLVDGENVVIDYNKTLEAKISENITVLSVFSALAGLSLIVAIVLYVIYRKMPKTKTEKIEECVWQVFGNNLPKTPKRNKAIIPIIVWLVIIFAGIIVMGIIGDSIQNETINIVVAVIFSVLFVAGFVLMFLISFVFLPKEEIKYYKKNYPFNSDEDILRQPIKKSLKNEWYEQIKAERIKNPDKFFDCGNGLEATFTEDGLLLREEVIDDLEMETQGVFEDFDDPNGKTELFNYTIPYEKLNFIAIPKYRKYANMFGVIIKSRLDDADSYPEQISFDIHIILDSNLLNSLRKFNIEVEGLDYILNNVEALMKENCPKAKSGLNTNNNQFGF